VLLRAVFRRKSELDLGKRPSEGSFSIHRMLPLRQTDLTNTSFRNVLYLLRKFHRNPTITGSLCARLGSRMNVLRIFSAYTVNPASSHSAEIGKTDQAHAA